MRPVDCPVLLGQRYRLPARLLAVRVPPRWLSSADIGCTPRRSGVARW